ncbi:MAG TPA: cytochrome c, partial [Myxococcota bacterium]|nr:cytochrome c [Myxococcota bacterium]
PKPRNYSDAAWQASITDEQLKKTIVEGGAAVGKSMMMPPNPDLRDKPQVVDELVKIIRGFKK